MSRWIFAALILANLGLLMWGRVYLETERPAIGEPMPQINPEKMRRPRETAAAKAPARDNAGTDAAVTQVPASPALTENSATAPACFRLGPFPDTAPAQKVEATLTGIPLTFTRREQTTRAVTGYRVFLPPFTTKEEAERRRRDLTRLGFKDHALMQEEGLQNAISLGVFAVEANAQNHIKKLAAKGIAAKLQPLEQTRTEYWIELAPMEPTAELRARLKLLLEGVSGSELTESLCIAPPAPSDQPQN